METETKLLNFILRADDQASGALNNASNSFGAFGKVGKLALLGIGAAIAGAGGLVAGLAAASESTAATAGEVRKLERELGLGAEAASRLRYEGDRLNIGTDQLSASFGMFAKKLAASHDDLSKYEIEVVKTKDGHVDFEKTLGVVADRFKGMPDGVEKSALAMQLFGRSGKDLIPLLDKGSAGLKDLGDEAQRMGLVFDDKALASAKRLTEGQKKLHDVMEGLKNMAAEQFIPIMADGAQTVAGFAEKFGPKVIEGIKSMGEKLQEVRIIAGDFVAAFKGKALTRDDLMLASIIDPTTAEKISDLIRRLGDTVRTFWQDRVVPAFDYLKTEAPIVWDKVKSAIETAWEKLQPVLKFAIDRLGDLKQRFDDLPPAAQKFLEAAAVAGVANSLLGDPVGDTIQKFSNLAQGMTALSQEGGIIHGLIGKLGALKLALGVTGVLGAIALLYVSWTENWGGIQEKTKTATDNIGSFLDGVRTSFEKQTTETLPNYANAFADLQAQAINPFRESINHMTKDDLPPLLTEMEKSNQKSKDYAASVQHAHEQMAKWEERGRKVGEALQWLWKHVLEPVAAFLADTFGKWLDDTISKVDGLISAIQTAIRIADGIAHIKIPNPFASTGGGPTLYGPNGDPVYNGPVVGYAGGVDTIVDRPHLFMAGERGAERLTVTPLSGGGGGGSANRPINVWVDGGLLAQLVGAETVEGARLAGRMLA